MTLSSAIPFTRRVSLCTLLLGPAAGLLLLSSFFALRAIAQEKGAAASPKQPAKLAHPAQSAPSEQQSKNKLTASRSPIELTTALPQHEAAEQLRKREEWFYKQRADPRGHIPAGARLKAFQHMQRMMEAEGKLVRRPDGSFAAVVPEAGPAVGGTWSALGPAPTTGGFFSPVSGRIEAIAVDPSDPTGNTVLVGGAQGGIWRSTDGGSTWTAVGDANASLAMGSIAFAGASSPGVVYAGTGEQADLGFDIYYGAGVLKSTDHGVTWTQTCTTASASCPFIGPFTNTLNFGFFNDGGARISYIAVNPQNPQLVLVGAQIPGFGSQSERAGGIFCSDNGGTTWTALLSGEAGSFVGFASSSVAYAALGRSLGTATGAPNPNGIYKSTNANGSCGTITFSPVATQPTTQAMGRIDLGIAASDSTGNTLYASVANGGINPTTGRPDGSRHNLGVFVTTNGGSTWTQTGAPDICQRQCWYDNVVKVDPANKDIVYLGGGAVATQTTAEWLERSTNGTTGGTFSSAIFVTSGSGLPHVDQHAIAFVKLPSTGKVRLYLGNDGGLWRTDDAEAATVSWQNLNQSSPAASGLTLTQFYPNVSVNPSNQNIAYGGAQDNGSQVLQRDVNGLNWANTVCGDGGQTAVDFQVPTSVYVSCQAPFLFFSPSGGTDPNSYAQIGAGIDPNGTDNVDFIPPIATDPSTPGRVYYGTDHVYQSSDNGSNFTAISGALAATFNTSNGPVHFALTALAVSPLTPSNTSVVYAGAEDGELFVATNVTAGSASFAAVGVNQLPLRNVTALVVDPADATGNTAYAVFSGFAVSSDHFGHIFKTANAGGLWTDVSCTNLTHCESPNATDLPNIPVNDLVVDPDVPGTIYAATDLGAFQGSCTGSVCTWNTLGTALPNVAVLSLKLHEPSRTLVAGTHGRGAWSLLVPLSGGFVGPHVSSISPISAQVGSASFTLTVDGSGLTGATAVQWKAGGTTTALTPTAVTASQVTATVPASLLSVGGTVQVSVSVGTTPSNSLTFGVIAGAPTISGVMPTSALVNSAATTITVTGTNFANNSQVMMNPDFAGGQGTTATGQVVIPTTFTDSQHLSATIPASFMANFGSTNSVGVHTPPPGGGTTFTTATVTLPTFTVIAPVPANDAFANAINITANSFTDTPPKDSSGATVETGEPALPCIAPISGNPAPGRFNTIWYKFMAPSSGTIAVDTIGSNYDTTLAAWTGSAVNSLTAVPGACNDDIVSMVNIVSQIGINATGGTTYFFQVGSFGTLDTNPVAFGGKAVFNFTFTPPPFTLTPVTPPGPSQTVTAGSPASYTIAVAPTGSFTGTVNLTCPTISPATSTISCSFNPASVTLGSGQNVTLTVSTIKRGALPPTGFRLPRKPVFRTVPLVILAILVALLMAFALRGFGIPDDFAGRTHRRRLALALPFAGLILLVLYQAIGCGGGGGGGGGTPAGTYTITVTGNGGGSTSNATVTLIVN